MVVLAGPNGSGKSTVTDGMKLDSEFPGVYINADDIAKNELGHHTDPVLRNVLAAQVANERRTQALNSGASFAFETVMSTPGKLAMFDDAKARGYDVRMVFVTTNDASINQERVKLRVEKGGHPVPPEKITERYDRAMQLLPSALIKSSSADVYDNSASNPLLVARKVDGSLKIEQDKVQWVKERLVPEMREYAQSRATLNQVAASINPKPQIEEANIARRREYKGQIVAVTSKEVLQQVDKDKFVIHDKALTNPKQTFEVGQEANVAYKFGPDGKHERPMSAEQLRAEAFREQTKEAALKQYPELAGAYAAQAALNRKIEADQLSPKQQDYARQQVREQLAKSIERGEIPQVQQRQEAAREPERPKPIEKDREI